MDKSYKIVNKMSKQGKIPFVKQDQNKSNIGKR